MRRRCARRATSWRCGASRASSTVSSTRPASAASPATRWSRCPAPRARCSRRSPTPAARRLAGCGGSGGGHERGARHGPGMPDAVVFDLDGVLIDSEERWNAAREALTHESGGTWSESATRDMMGMSAPEWSAYLRSELGVPMSDEDINAEVVARMQASFRGDVPVLPGAVEAVRSLASCWPLALASSANREIITLVLEVCGLADCFRATVSSEEVERGKPAPDVYLEAARRLDASPEACVAVEDSTNGLRSAHAAGLAVIAVPNRAYAPDPEALELAEAV